MRRCLGGRGGELSSLFLTRDGGSASERGEITRVGNCLLPGPRVVDWHG